MTKCLGLATLWLTLLASAAPAKKVTFPVCAGGRFLVQGSSLITGDAAPENAPFVIKNQQISIGTLCPAVHAAMKGKKVGTTVKATWQACPGFHGMARIKATIDPECAMMVGTFIARKAHVRTRFMAHRSTCGDGVVDPGAGEQCDSGGCGPAERCAACACVPADVSTTTVTVTTTSSSSTLSTSTTIPPADTTAPELQAFSVSPTMVDTSAGTASVAVHIEASDDLSGFGGGSNGLIDVKHKSGVNSVGQDSLPMTAGTALHPIFDFTLTFPQFSQPGMYPIALALVDSAGNRADFTSDMLAARSLPAQIVVDLPAGPPDPAVYGRWGSVIPLPHVAIHVHMLPTGKVMFWDTGADTPAQWDPITGDIGPLAAPGFDAFCSGHSFLADGRLLVTGGNIEDDLGLALTSIYDPFWNIWTRQPDMNLGRWYPTNTTLANGDVLTIAGTYGDGTLNPDGTPAFFNNRLPQVFQTGTGTWRDLTGAMFDIPLYPFMYLAPNGQVFAAGPMQKTRYVDTAGGGTLTLVGFSNFGIRDRGTSVMYDDGRVLIAGGSQASSDPPTNTAEVIDLTAPAPAWRFVASMARARRHLNSTLLPDGTVLVTGGTSARGFNNSLGEVLPAELWDPVQESWSTMAPMQTPRLYHATAALLPDGRVFCSGGGHPSDIGNGDPPHFDAEVYSPPYLFHGPRPALDSAPTHVKLGETFVVDTADATSITAVTLIRLASVTHGFNQNQRINRLGFSPTTGGLNVIAPSDANLCPPGHYMLFLLNGTGVPSIAKIIEVDRQSADLSLTAAASPISPGGDITYTLEVQNLGPDDAQFLKLTDVLPANATFVSATSAELDCVPSGGMVRCRTDLFASGAHATVVIVLHATDAAPVVNRVAVTAASPPDPDLGNNQATL